MSRMEPRRAERAGQKPRTPNEMDYLLLVPPAYAGTDFIVARNGRIASVYLFFDNLP
jgi:hypothetical protein